MLPEPCFPRVADPEGIEPQRHILPTSHAHPSQRSACASDAELSFARSPLTTGTPTTGTVSPLSLPSASIFFSVLCPVLGALTSSSSRFLSQYSRALLRRGCGCSRLSVTLFIFIVSAPFARALQSVPLPPPSHAAACAARGNAALR